MYKIYTIQVESNIDILTKILWRQERVILPYDRCDDIYTIAEKSENIDDTLVAIKQKRINRIDENMKRNIGNRYANFMETYSYKIIKYFGATCDIKIKQCQDISEISVDELRKLVNINQWKEIVGDFSK